MSETKWVGGAGRLTGYGDPGFSTFTRRAFAKGMGFTDEGMGRPIIGICNSWSELNHCNSHLKDLAEAVKRGVWSPVPVYCALAAARSSSTRSTT